MRICRSGTIVKSIAAVILVVGGALVSLPRQAGAASEAVNLVTSTQVLMSKLPDSGIISPLLSYSAVLNEQLLYLERSPQGPGTVTAPITTRASRSNCIVPDLGATEVSITGIQTAVSAFDATTQTTVTCLLAYTDSASTWAQWDDPWITNPNYGFTTWVQQAPQVRQLVLGIDLIPIGLADIKNPLNWERSCAAGAFDSYATTLGTNLVAAGLQNSVIRLGPEMNGTWENDFVGNTTQEQNLWARCFADEVTSLRQASGAHFIIDWNVNSCTENIPYANFYPGNTYVDVVGLDFYDQSCLTPNADVPFSTLANLPDGLSTFESFAAAKGKAMSFPEWGLVARAGGDDPAYVNGIGTVVNAGNFAFQAYFDPGNDGILQLGPSAPLATKAYSQQFG